MVGWLVGCSDYERTAGVFLSSGSFVHEWSLAVLDKRTGLKDFYVDGWE